MAAKDPFRSKQPPQSVRDEFDARADGAKLLKWVSTRYPWVYILSCADCGEQFNEFGNDPTKAPPDKALALRGDNVSLAVYSSKDNIPLPHVDQLDVKALGSLGTTRKAVVKIKCYSDEHLVELQKCFFIPGMDVRVQWGWSESCSGVKMTNDKLFQDPETNPSEIICKINKQRKSLPMYDGFQGIVTNFKYGLNAENTWDCELEIISAADPFSGSKVGNSQCGCPGSTSTDMGEKKKDFGPMYEMLKDMYYAGLTTWRKKKSELFDLYTESTRRECWHFKKWNYYGVERTETGGEKEGSWWDDIFDGEETVESWMSFGAFVDILNSFAIPHDGNKWPYGNVDVSNVYLPYPPGELVFADPRCFYIQGGDSINIYSLMEGDRGSDGAGEWAIVDGSSIGKTAGSRFIRLGKIMCNVIWLNKIYKQNYDGDGSIKALIEAFLREFNRMCGNPWEFITIGQEEDCGDNGDQVPDGPALVILDGRAAQAINAPFEIPSKIGDSTLRDFQLNMKMTSAMKTQALYANNHQQTKGDNGSGCLGTAFKPFYSSAQITNRAKPKPGTAQVDCGGCEKGGCGGPSLSTLKHDVWDETNDQTTGGLQEYANKYVQCSRSDCRASRCPASTQACAGMALPFDFSFEIDGIGGFEFGQAITSSRIPKAIRESFRWQVTKVEHSIKPGDWKTSVSTVCRANPVGTDIAYGKATT